MGRNRLGKLRTKSVKITIPEYVYDYMKDKDIVISELVTTLLLRHFIEKKVNLEKYKEEI